MAKVTIAGNMLNIEIHGLDKLWSLKSRLEISLDHIQGAAPDPEIARHYPGWRWPGTYVPGVLSAGTFRKKGESAFWDVRNPAKVIVIELADESFRRLVLEVDDPAATAAAIGEAISGRNR